MPELIDYLKANPGKLSYGSSGAGTSTHLASELFQIKTGTTMTHVPYRCSGDVMNRSTGGHIDLAFDNMTLAWPQAQAGTVRASRSRASSAAPTAPDVPPVAETLPGFEATSWHGVFAPAGDAAADRRQDRRRGEAHLRAARGARRASSRSARCRRR